MIWIPMAWFFFRALTRNPFPRTRQALKAAQKRVKASKAARRAGTW